MAKALFVNKTEVAKFTAISGNLNDDKIIPFIEIAQDTHVFNYLGQQLFEKISNGIIAANLTADYLTLLNDYIKPMTIHWTLVEYLPFGAMQVANGGVYKMNSEKGNAAERQDVDYLVEKSRTFAQSYTQKFIDYMIINYAKYPEYYLYSQIGKQPAMGEVLCGNWYLGSEPHYIQNDAGPLKS